MSTTVKKLPMGRIDHVNDTAEGTCKGVPYDTQLVSINGVRVHFWLGDNDMPTPELLASLERAMRNERDVVAMTWSTGRPTGFWANHDIN